MLSIYLIDFIGGYFIARVLTGSAASIGMFVTSLSQGKNVVEAFVLAFICFALISGLTRLAFWLLELALENWG